MNRLLLYPMAFYVFYIFGLFLMLFRARAGAVRSNQAPLEYFATFTGAELPERLLVKGRHYDNQFQVPMVFFLTCITHLYVGQVDALTLMLAWGFVLSRLVHSYIHLGSNDVVRRLQVYALGWLLVLALWVQLMFFVDQL